MITVVTGIREKMSDFRPKENLLNGQFTSMKVWKNGGFVAINGLFVV